MHPGEQHIRSEMVNAIHDHFNDLAITVDGIAYAVEIWPGGSSRSTVIVMHPNGVDAVAQYRIKVSAERVPSPKVGSPKVAPTQLPPAPTSGSTLPTVELPALPEPTPSALPTPIEGVWGSVTSGDIVLDDAGTPWEVVRNGDSVTITSATDSYTFAPPVTQVVKYLPTRSEGV